MAKNKKKKKDEVEEISSRAFHRTTNLLRNLSEEFNLAHFRNLGSIIGVDYTGCTKLDCVISLAETILLSGDMSCADDGKTRSRFFAAMDERNPGWRERVHLENYLSK